MGIGTDRVCSQWPHSLRPGACGEEVPPPPPCPGTALRKNRPLVSRSNSRANFFYHRIGFFEVLVDAGQGQPGLSGAWHMFSTTSCFSQGTGFICQCV